MCVCVCGSYQYHHSSHLDRAEFWSRETLSDTYAIMMCACLCVCMRVWVPMCMCVLTWDEGAGWERRGESAGEEAESCDWSGGRREAGAQCSS